MFNRKKKNLVSKGFIIMMTKSKFPVLAVILLVFALVWLVNELGYLNINPPWLPVILIVIAIGMIFNRFRR